MTIDPDTGTLTMVRRDRPPPASLVAIEALPVVDVVEPDSQCVICLSEYEAGGDKAKEMPCGHRFRYKILNFYKIYIYIYGHLIFFYIVLYNK